MSSQDDPFAPPRHGYGPPAYGRPAYGPPPQTSSRAVAVLVLAACSFVVLPLIPAIVALALAPGAAREIAASGGRLTGDGLVRAGRIAAWVNIGLFIGFVLFLALMVVVLGILSTTAS